MNPKCLAIFQMLICAFLWSTGGIFIKLIPWNPFVIAGCRSLIAAATVFAFIKITRTNVRFDRRSMAIGFFMSLNFFCFLAANKLTTAANAIVIQFTNPLFLLAFSAMIFGTKFRRSDILAVILTILGIALFFFDSIDGGYIAGNLVALLGGVMTAGTLLSIGGGGEESRIGGILLGHLLTAAVGIPFAFFTENPVSTVPLLAISALGVVQLGIPYILLVLSTRHCPPLACSLLGALEPLLNPVWVAIFDGEKPGVFALIGGVIVIVSVSVWVIWQQRHPLPEIVTATHKTKAS